MGDDRECIRRLDTDSIVPTCVSPNTCTAQGKIIAKILFEQSLRSVESIYERAFASRTVSMGKQM